MAKLRRQEKNAFSVKSNFDEYLKELKEFQKKDVPSTIAGALNRTATRIRKEAVDSAAKKHGIKNRQHKKELTKRLPKPGKKRRWMNASKRNLRAVIIQLVMPANIKTFHGDKEGGTVKVGRHTVKDTFRVKKWRHNFFQREGQKGITMSYFKVEDSIKNAVNSWGHGKGWEVMKDAFQTNMKKKWEKSRAAR